MGHMGKGVSCVILKVEMGVPWGMGHMGNWAHDHNVGKWVSWLILKIEMGHLGGWGTLGDGAHGQCGHVLDHVQLP